MYLYISTSNPDVLAARQKQRLSKAASTLAKKLAWAKQQVAKASTPALFDDVVVNTSLAEVGEGSEDWVFGARVCLGPEASMILRTTEQQAVPQLHTPTVACAPQSYAALKEAISKLSPIIRNRCACCPVVSCSCGLMPDA